MKVKPGKLLFPFIQSAEMACTQMAVRDLFQLRFLFGTDLLGHKASGVEDTAGGGVRRAWQISLENNLFSPAVALRNRDGR